MKKPKHIKTIRKWWLPYLWEDLANKNEMIKLLCDDWADDDTYIENLCFKYGFSEDEVWGDSWYRPGIQEKVDMLCSLIPEEKIKVSNSGKHPLPDTVPDHQF